MHIFVSRKAHNRESFLRNGNGWLGFFYLETIDTSTTTFHPDKALRLQQTQERGRFSITPGPGSWKIGKQFVSKASILNHLSIFSMQTTLEGNKKEFLDVKWKILLNSKSSTSNLFLTNITFLFFRSRLPSRWKPETGKNAHNFVFYSDSIVRLLSSNYNFQFERRKYLHSFFILRLQSGCMSSLHRFRFFHSICLSHFIEKHIWNI